MKDDFVSQSQPCADAGPNSPRSPLVTEAMLDAGHAAFSRMRPLLSMLILPWTSTRLGLDAAYRAMEAARSTPPQSPPRSGVRSNGEGGEA
jgi:hypothetical protein